MPVAATEKRKRLKEELAAAGVLVVPGAFNAICARFVQHHGFRATYVSGSATAAAAFALPDLGLVSLTEAVREAGLIAQAVDIPTLADADTGFGDLTDIPRTVAEFEAAGVAGIHIEDQVFPKRCGHLDGKEVIPREEMVRKVELAVASRQDHNFLIIARCDAFSVSGFEDMRDRCQAYADAGADMIFPEALTELEAFEKTAAALSVPLLANMTEFGKTPYYRVQQLADAGCKVVLFPLSVFRATMGAMDRALQTLRAEGSQESFLDSMFSREEFYEFIDYASHEARVLGLTPQDPGRP